VDLGPDADLDYRSGTSVIISPDGTRLAFISQGRLFTQPLDQPAAGRCSFAPLARSKLAESPCFDFPPVRVYRHWVPASPPEDGIEFPGCV